MMDKMNLISVINIMIGLTEKEINELMAMDEEVVEQYYINRFLEQNDDQLTIAF